jgi:hypothetical protein
MNPEAAPRRIWARRASRLRTAATRYVLQGRTSGPSSVIRAREGVGGEGGGVLPSPWNKLPTDIEARRS